MKLKIGLNRKASLSQFGPQYRFENMDFISELTIETTEEKLEEDNKKYRKIVSDMLNEEIKTRFKELEKQLSDTKK